MDEHTAILYINRSDSRCGYCNKHVLPELERHDIQVGYGVEPGTPGCGARFIALSSDYDDPYLREAAQSIRPDLPWTTTLH